MSRPRSAVATELVITHDGSSDLFYLEGLPLQVDVDTRHMSRWLGSKARLVEVVRCFTLRGSRMFIETANCDAAYVRLEEGKKGLDLYELEWWTMKGAWA